MMNPTRTRPAKGVIHSLDTRVSIRAMHASILSVASLVARTSAAILDSISLCSLSWWYIPACAAAI